MKFERIQLNQLLYKKIYMKGVNYMFAENEILIYKSIIKEIKELWWACNLKEQTKVLSNKLHPWLIRNLNAENLDKQIEHLNNLNLGIILKPENSFIVLYIKTRNMRYYQIDEFLLNL